MASWDVFHADRLELERGLSTAAIREALARGELRDDDLVRPAGTTVAWARLADMPELLEPARAAANRIIPLIADRQRPSAGARAGATDVASRRRSPSDFEIQTAKIRGPSLRLAAADGRRAPAWFELADRIR